MSAGRLWSSWVWQEKPNKARREAWGESRTLARAMADQIERLQILNKLQPHHHVATLGGSRTVDLRGSSKGDGRGQQSSHSALVRDADWDCGTVGPWQLYLLLTGEWDKMNKLQRELLTCSWSGLETVCHLSPGAGGGNIFLRRKNKRKFSEQKENLLLWWIICLKWSKCFKTI